MDVLDGMYRKRVDPTSGKALPEDNWVWSPQGAIDMHMPERWGVVQFSDAIAGTREVAVVPDGNDLVKWALRRLYYRQRSYRATHGHYAIDLEALRAGDIRVGRPELQSVAARVTAQLRNHGRRCRRQPRAHRQRREGVGHAPLGGASPMKPKERRSSLRSY